VCRNADQTAIPRLRSKVLRMPRSLYFYGLTLNEDSRVRVKKVFAKKLCMVWSMRPTIKM
jgi:hypothetical protein